MRKKEIAAGIIVMLVITLLSGYLLAQVFKTAKPRIAEQKIIEEKLLNKEIFPEGVTFEDASDSDMSYVIVYDTENNQLGRIFVIRPSGYGGTIVVKVGIDNDLKIKSVRILSHNETPGLGSKIKENSFINQFAGKAGNALYLKNMHPEGEINAVTGATISSRAVDEGIAELQKKLSGKNLNE